jgi:hypothetical protein
LSAVKVPFGAISWLALTLALLLVTLQGLVPNSSLLSSRFVTADRNTPELSVYVPLLARVKVTRGSRVLVPAKFRSSGGT